MNMNLFELFGLSDTPPGCGTNYLEVYPTKPVNLDITVQTRPQKESNATDR